MKQWTYFLLFLILATSVLAFPVEDVKLNNFVNDYTSTLTQEEIPSILRTTDNGCWEVYDGTWGSYLRPAFDPDANAVITDEHLKHFQL